MKLNNSSLAIAFIIIVITISNYLWANKLVLMD